MGANRLSGPGVAAGIAAIIIGLAGAPAGLAQDAGAQGDGQRLTAERKAPTVDQIAQLVEQRKMVEAHAALSRLLSDGSLDALTAEQATRALRLRDRVEEALRSMDQFEVSLDKARIALRDGDLRQAERHANAVRDRAFASDEQKRLAARILNDVSQRRAELKPVVLTTLLQAIEDYDAGRYAQAKAGLTAAQRVGARLDPDTQHLLDEYLLRVLDREQASGERFEADPSPAVFQPGAVRRTGENERADDPPAAEPEDDLIRAALRAEAQRILAEADLAFEEGRYNEAADKYAMVTTRHRRHLSQDELSRANDRLSEAQVRLGAGVDIRQDTVRSLTLQRQQAEAQFNNEIEQARRALEAGDTSRANELAARARLTISARRAVFSETEYDRFMSRVDELRRDIEVASERIRRQEAERRERELRERAREAEVARARERERRINEAIDRVRALQQEMKYQEALEVVEQILFLDPINPTGLLLRDILTDVVVYQRFDDIQRRKAIGHVELRLDTEEAMVPPRRMVEYPQDWPRKSFERGELMAFVDSPADRRVLAELDSRRIPVNFDDVALQDVLTFVAQVTDIDMDVDWESLREIGVEPERLVRLNLSAVPVRVVLDRVLERASRDVFARAGWAVNDGILTVASEEVLRRNTQLLLYNITDLLLDIPDYDDAPQIDLQSVLQASQRGGGGGGGQSPFQQVQDQQEERPSRQERIDRIIDIIQTNVDFEGWIDNGGDTGRIQELNGNLIVTNTPRNHREIVGLLSKLREARAMQINVETKFLLVSQDWFEQIGFNIDLVINANNNQVRTARAADPTILPGDFFDFSGPGGGLQRNVQGGIPLGGGTLDDRVTRGTVNPTQWTPIGFQQGSLGLAGRLAQGDFANTILDGAPALGIAGQFLDDIQVDFLIQATQADRRNVTLTAPRLTFTNGQVANIFVVTQQAFISDLEPVTGDSAVGFDPTVATVSEGVVMLVEGVISADRRYVTMNVDTSVGQVDGFAREAVTAVAGGQLVTSADTQSFIQLPTVTVTRVRTTVTVPDEGTVLLGGQRLVTEVEVETGVPVLSKLPIINRFFTNRIESKEEQTLLVLIKPTILIQSEEEERQFPGLSDSLRLGQPLP